MLHFYQKVALVVFLASFGGELALHWLKNLLVETNPKFSLEISGIIERSLIIIVMFISGPILFLLPLIILIRASYAIISSHLEKYSGIIDKNEPAMLFQRVKIKQEIIVSIVASPLTALLIGYALRSI